MGRGISQFVTMLVVGVVVLELVLVAAAALADEPLSDVKWVSVALAEAMSRFTVSADPNSDCTRHSRLYHQNLVNSTLWAVTMLDSSSVSVGGVLSGDLYSLGHYDQCLAVRVPEARLQAQYCLATLQYGPDPQARPAFYGPPADTYVEPPHTASVWDKVKMTLDPGITRRDVLHWALCVPSSCSALDLQQSLNTSLQPVFKRQGLWGSATVVPQHCRVAGDDDVEPHTVGYEIIKFVICVCLLVAAAATTYDYLMPYLRDQKAESALTDKLEKIFLGFSVRRNMNELVEKGSNPKLDAMNGGKVISMAAIIFGHRTMFSHGLSLQNQEHWEQLYTHHFWDMAIMSGTHLVDTFFVCSGLLTFLGINGVLEKRKAINIPLAIFLRWLRIVPAYLIMMGVVGWLLPLMGDGPLWRQRVGLESARCQENWWLNLLFINNYVNADSQCLLLSWYLACDMQFFVVAIFAIYVLWRWPRLGQTLFGVLLVASVAVPFYVTYVNNYSGTLKLYASTLLKNPFTNDHFIAMYVKSHTRAGAYIIGVLSGYAVTKLADANYKIPGRTAFLGFLLFFFGGYAVQTYSYNFYQPDHSQSQLESALYAALHRHAFSIGMAWIYIVHYNSGFGLIKVLFGQYLYTPLGRLIYCVMLVHPSVQLAQAASVRHTEHMRYSSMFWMACGDYLVSHLLALPLHLLVEAPSRTMVKLLFQPDPPSDKTSQLKKSEKHSEIAVISRL